MLSGIRKPLSVRAVYLCLNLYPLPQMEFLSVLNLFLSFIVSSDMPSGKALHTGFPFFYSYYQKKHNLSITDMAPAYYHLT